MVTSRAHFSRVKVNEDAVSLKEKFVSDATSPLQKIYYFLGSFYGLPETEVIWTVH